MPEVSLLASIPSPAENGFHIGPLFFRAYGICYVFAVLGAVVVTTRRWEKLGGDGALFLITSWNEVPDAWWGPFAIWRGGLGIWGGIAAGTLAGIWVLHRRGANIPLFMDCVAPGLLVAQAIGRVGNWFNQELFGGPTSLPWGLEIDRAHRPAGYLNDPTFHPTFLYEIIWNLGLAAFLVWLGHHRRIRPPGLFALYVAGYSLGRIGEELLRVDPAHHIFGLRLNFFVAIALLVVGVVWFIRVQRRPGEPDPRPYPRATGTPAAGVAGR
jgi:prolipoprotein diacylglyceryl transferase